MSQARRSAFSLYATISASRASSSKCRTRMRRSIRFQPEGLSGRAGTTGRRRLVEIGPEYPDGLDRFEEIVEAHRFHHVGIGAQRVSLAHVTLLTRGREHD